MTKKKLVTFKDYINALKRLQKVAHDLEDIDKDMGGQFLVWMHPIQIKGK